MVHSHYNPNYQSSIFVKTETNKLKLLWWRITYKFEDWYDRAEDFIDYIKQYKYPNG